MTDIKKAFNQFKKDIKKEGLDLTGSCYMTAKQIQNRTATILICNNIPYEKEIRDTTLRMQKVLGYDTWTDEEKVRNAKSSTASILKYTQDLMKYGTKDNEFKQTRQFILNSTAWKKFVEAVGSEVQTIREDKDIGMYLRILY